MRRTMLILFAIAAGCVPSEPPPTPKPLDAGMCLTEGSLCHGGNQCCANTPSGVSLECNGVRCARKCSQIGAPCDTVADCCMAPFKTQCLGHACSPA
jgi:hypothetical protein